MNPKVNWYSPFPENYEIRRITKEMRIKSKEEMKMEYRTSLFGIQENEPQVFEEEGPMADGSGDGDNPDGDNNEPIQTAPELDYDRHEIHPN
jgi:hypothetical protein